MSLPNIPDTWGCFCPILLLVHLTVIEHLLSGFYRLFLCLTMNEKNAKKQSVNNTIPCNLFFVLLLVTALHNPYFCMVLLPCDAHV